MTSTPEVVLLRNVSRLATQQMASGDAVNQIPRYLLVGTPVGEKKPRVKDPPAETSVAPSVMLLPLSSVSDAVPAADVVRQRRSGLEGTEVLSLLSPLVVGDSESPSPSKFLILRV